METRRQQGIPDGKSALGCKKIVETGKKDFFYCLSIEKICFFNNSVTNDLRILIIPLAYGETNTTRGCSWEDHTIGRSEENAHLVPCYKSGGIITGEMKNHYTFV